MDWAHAVLHWNKQTAVNSALVTREIDLRCCMVEKCAN